MSKAKTLAEQFAEVQAALDEAQRTYDRVRSSYFFDRRKRAKAGEELEPLVCTDSNAWSDQLGREDVDRRNGAEDRRAGLAPVDEAA